MEGSGKMLVTAVGVNSQTGIIMTLLGATKTDKNETKAKAKANANGVNAQTNACKRKHFLRGL